MEIEMNEPQKIQRKSRGPRLSDESAGDDERNHFAESYGGAPLNSIAARITRHATRRLSIMDLPGFRYAGRDWVEARRLADIDMAEAEHFCSKPCHDSYHS
jgi:hypothetical protein